MTIETMCYSSNPGRGIFNEQSKSTRNSHGRTFHSRHGKLHQEPGDQRHGRYTVRRTRWQLRSHRYNRNSHRESRRIAPRKSVIRSQERGASYSLTCSSLLITGQEILNRFVGAAKMVEIGSEVGIRVEYHFANVNKMINHQQKLYN